ncbi:MAG: IclR family transcriptional regulator [Mesorhizobium sp.]|uniref:IclR family transcriptional regulator n=1 Tax=Mesorhizobium sp. M00.F.Ca.ET.217.01.1.1 TaxID=2500529 RepID=UPI000FD99F88|nr:IclR family transcriptional regulator [Mesorhizobium sp. M00.F.Ca.ET.217.01.1.1]RWC99748.1 MAG: IclR family transcriptional regulator [Mesorhizobium sp.]TGQ19130.1 IclR family transcriptional regulator [Mesorhizobium sp. M00.F.Ca.ET.217.01.1.1]TGV90019.1 IclR family transcriptional regulator [Mesorhizobium sp. M00.F.Ca.ET.158.01.1.1]
MRVVNSLVERCFAVIELLAKEASAMRLGEIAEKLDLQKSAAHRMLNLLSEIGWVEQEPVTGFYKLTLRLAILGQRFLSATHLTDVCLPVLEDLATESAELVRMAVVQGETLTWIAQVQGARNGLKYQPEMVARVRMYTTANGRAYLSTLSQTDAIRIAINDGAGEQPIASVEEFMRELELARKRGWAISDEKAEPGVVAIAAPITLGGSQTVGTVSVAGPISRLTPDRHQKVASSVLSTAAKLGELWPLRQRYANVQQSE